MSSGLKVGDTEVVDGASQRIGHREFRSPLAEDHRQIAIGVSASKSGVAKHQNDSSKDRHGDQQLLADRAFGPHTRPP